MALEILSAVTGCVSLALEIYGFFKSALPNDSDDFLILSIRHDISVLRDFAKIFETASKDERIPESDKLLLNEMCIALQPILMNIHSLVFRKRMADLTASRMRMATEVVLRFLYKKEELQRISRALFQWTERYHIRFGLLPRDLQGKLLAASSEGDTSTASSLRALRDTFEQLTLQSEHVPSIGLLRLETDINFRSGAPYNNTLVGRELALFESEVAKLVKLLSCVDATLCRILKVAGYFHQGSRFCFGMIYKIPRNVLIPAQDTPTTLHDLIGRTREAPNRPGHVELAPPEHPLEQRFELDRKIACAVMYVHVMQYVHKSIRPSNIVMFSKKAAPGTVGSSPPGESKNLGEPFLCGFETARHDRATSDQRGDAHWRYNIYRHPKRQGLHPQERYTMNHDIYSLGVVLLEIGLWRPLLSTGLAKLKNSSDEDIAAGKVKAYLKKIAVERLPVTMGSKYCGVVLFCLNVDGDGQVGNCRLIEEVLSKLEELSTGLQ
ncbi:hypothetical protein GQ43DRAFT_480477 [Delitschia confertaspora ATCC 74209]|uniref:Protein kinase domain-containing protein n=1 Tax=Delitschia confertaspora ATCC 74209 TaxID=1513339 RepID=A0A9P4MSR5_9PLEO|nr:hypothetical protein GQ43DRAFT_480477 [Delitschia confertaspora ATCC 74209]